MPLGTRSRKIIGDIWGRKVRTLLVSSSIFIGVFGVVTLFSAGEILIDQLEKDIKPDRLAMVRMQVSTTAGAAVDNAATLNTLSREPGVIVVEGRAVFPLYWKTTGDTSFNEGTIVAYTPALRQTVLEPPRIIDGSAPQAGQQQIAIERRMADRYGLDIGDTLDLRILTAAGTNAAPGADHVVQETWTISGIIFQPYSERGGTGPIDADKLVYATYNDAQHIAGFAGLSTLYARFTDFGTADAEAARFQAAVGDLTPYIPVFTQIEDPATSSLIESTRSTNRLLVILALVALVVSGFLVINVINSIVSEQRKQIGVMKSLGATRFDTFMIYSGIALMYGLIGVIPGVLLGIPGGYFAAKGLAAQSNTIIDQFAISPTAILLGVIVGLAVPFLASILPVITGTRVTILEAMTDMGIDATYGRSLIARIIARLPLPVALRQALNNVNQKKFRLALTGTTLTVAVGAFMGIFAVFSSLGDVVDNVFASLGTDASIEPNEGQALDTIRPLLTSDEFKARLEAAGLPAIASITPGASLSIEIEGYNPPPISAGPPGIFAFGYDTTVPELAKLTFDDGSGWDNDPEREGVVISSRIGDLLDKAAGDSIVILAGGGRGEYTILGVASYPYDAVWMKWDDLARLGGLILGGASAQDYQMGTTYVTLPASSDPASQVGVLGLDSAFANYLSYIEGDVPAAEANELLVNTALAEREKLAVGDTLTIDLNGQSARYTVNGIIELPAQASANPNHPEEVIGVWWQELAALEGRSTDGQPYPNAIDLLLATDDPTVQQVEGVVKQVNETLLANGITSSATNWVEFKETITGYITLFNVILNLAAALIAAVGAIGLLTSLSMSVFERQKEIGVMRSVGASSGAVAFQFLIEGLVIGVVAWLIGIPLSYLLGQGLIAALPFEDYGIGFPLTTLIVGLVGMLIITTLASLWPSLNAARRTVSDILRYQ